jgi:thiosulfate/3-mercaptopyruvate sulfurtransferase
MTEIQSIVSAAWLEHQLDNPQVLVVDCRFQLANPSWGHQQYLVNHIPGAHYLDLDKDLSSPILQHGGRHPLPEPEQLAAKLAAIGVNFGDTLVVAYDDSRFAFASRLWWLLRYLGHFQVALLDGGWKGWLEDGYPTSDRLPTPLPGNFIPQVQSDWILDIEQVKGRKELPSVVLVDSREGERYRGEKEPIDPIAGHIPGAVNVPWQQVTDARGYLYPPSTQEKLWKSYEQPEEIIVYCGSGVTACVNLFSLELVGNRKAKLYPGGWSDWCSYLDLSSISELLHLDP